MFYKLRKITLVWISQAEHEKGVRAHLWQSLTTECPLSEEVYLLNVFTCAFLTLAAKHRTTFPTFYTRVIFLYFIANKIVILAAFSFHITLPNTWGSNFFFVLVLTPSVFRLVFHAVLLPAVKTKFQFYLYTDDLHGPISLAFLSKYVSTVNSRCNRRHQDQNLVSLIERIRNYIEVIYQLFQERAGCEVIDNASSCSHFISKKRKWNDYFYYILNFGNRCWIFFFCHTFGQALSSQWKRLSAAVLDMTSNFLIRQKALKVKAL